MKLYFFFLFIYGKYSLCEYTAYRVMLWLSSDEDVVPSVVWSDSDSRYNNGTNLTVNDFLQTGARGYRNTFIDNWSSNPPDKMRLTYRNKDGDIIFKQRFNSTGSSYTDWFTVSKVLEMTWLSLSYQLHHMYSSFSIDFSMTDSSTGVIRYRAGSLKLSNGTVKFIVGAGQSFAILPSLPTAEGDCYASYQTSNRFSINTTTTNLTHRYCSAFCRERNYISAGVHGDTCSCLDAAVSGPTLTACTLPCEGNSEDLCGGSIPPAIIFNSVNTDIDISQFDQPVIQIKEVQVADYVEVTFESLVHLYGFNMSVSQTHFPATIRILLLYRAESCNSTKIRNSTYEKIFSVPAVQDYFIIEMEPLLVQCVYMFVYDNSTDSVVTFPVNMTTLTIQSHNFVTAQYLTIEAAWRTDTDIGEVQTTTAGPSDECECDCWVYNLLYGESPYINLSYKQIEEVLKNVTQKIEKELAVNKSSLSSTIRKKTSAEDSRRSAAVIGYTLGVTLLVSTLAALLLSDLPKMIASLGILRENCKSMCAGQEFPDSPSARDGRNNGRNTHADNTCN